MFEIAIIFIVNMFKRFCSDIIISMLIDQNQFRRNLIFIIKNLI